MATTRLSDRRLCERNSLENVDTGRRKWGGVEGKRRREGREGERRRGRKKNPPFKMSAYQGMKQRQKVQVFCGSSQATNFSVEALHGGYVAKIVFLPLHIALRLHNEQCNVV